jgi:pyruvate-formate lyase
MNLLNIVYEFSIWGVVMNHILDKGITRKLEIAREFTRVYRENINENLAIKEAKCLAVYFPAFCEPLQDHDLIAGRLLYKPLVGFGLEQVFNSDLDEIVLDDTAEKDLTDEQKYLRSKLGWSNCGFVFDYSSLKKLQNEYKQDSSEYGEIEDLISFWIEESSRSKYNQAIPEEINRHLGKSTALDMRYVNGFFRLCCYSLDYDKLLLNGIPGMKDIVKANQEKAIQSGTDELFYEAMLMALDIISSIVIYYELQCEDLLAVTADPDRRQELDEMRDALHAIRMDKPKTLRQAVQLFWIYNLVTDTPNYGRMDVYLGDFLVNDLEKNILTEEEALQLLQGLWQLISEIRYTGETTVSNARIIVGGKGRRNPRNADRFALTAMEVSRRIKTCEPNLTLRFYKGQSPLLMEKALDLIADGCVHPGLYNDDVHIPMVMQAHNVPEVDAEQYLPEGCGELVIDHMAIGSPNNILNFLNALDLVLHNGIDTDLNERRGLALGTADEFDTFEKLIGALKQQVDFTNKILARRHKMELDVHKQTAAYLFVSMLSDDCISRGKSVFDGGIRYSGGIIETFGLTNVTDSLYAIKKLVYEQHRYTLQELVSILDNNWEGHEQDRLIMLNLPKYGNDHAEVDGLYKELNEAFCLSAYEKGKEEGLHFFLNCNLNPGADYYKHHTKASADGRAFSEAMAYGNAPTAGRDTSGLTSLLNSMAKNNALHAGYVHNLKVSKNMLIGSTRIKFRLLIETYFDNGGAQLMITALNREDLENAQKEPEKYQNLIVRIAGITLKFVECSEAMQQELITRTFYA